MEKEKDFSKAERAGLRRQGLTIVGTQAIPAYDGDMYFSGRGYLLSDGRLLSYFEVVSAATGRS